MVALGNVSDFVLTPRPGSSALRAGVAGMDGLLRIPIPRRPGGRGDLIGSLCDVAHQVGARADSPPRGLLHDKEFGLLHNRARSLHPRLGRFLQRDPLGYDDGMSLYEYPRSNPIGNLDPNGTQTTKPKVVVVHPDSYSGPMGEWKGARLGVHPKVPVRLPSGGKATVSAWSRFTEGDALLLVPLQQTKPKSLPLHWYDILFHLEGTEACDKCKWLQFAKTEATNRARQKVAGAIPIGKDLVELGRMNVDTTSPRGQGPWYAGDQYATASANIMRDRPRTPPAQRVYANAARFRTVEWGTYEGEYHTFLVCFDDRPGKNKKVPHPVYHAKWKAVSKWDRFKLRWGQEPLALEFARAITKDTKLPGFASGKVFVRNVEWKELRGKFQWTPSFTYPNPIPESYRSPTGKPASRPN